MISIVRYSVPDYSVPMFGVGETVVVYSGWQNIQESFGVLRRLGSMRLFGKVDSQIVSHDRPHPMGEIFVPGESATQTLWVNIPDSMAGADDGVISLGMGLFGVQDGSITRLDRPRHMGEVFTVESGLVSGGWLNLTSAPGTWQNIDDSVNASAWRNIAETMATLKPLSGMRLFGKVDSQVVAHDRPHPMGEIFVISGGTTSPWLNIPDSMAIDSEESSSLATSLFGRADGSITRLDRPRHMAEIFALLNGATVGGWTNSESVAGTWLNIAASAGSAPWLNITADMTGLRRLPGMRLFGKVDSQVVAHDRPHPMGEIFVPASGTSSPWTNIPASMATEVATTESKMSLFGAQDGAITTFDRPRHMTEVFTRAAGVSASPWSNAGGTPGGAWSNAQGSSSGGYD